MILRPVFERFLQKSPLSVMARATIELEFCKVGIPLPKGIETCTLAIGGARRTVMAAIIDFPQVVQEALHDFGDLLPNEPQRRHFAEYLTGLFVAERKNSSGINREFAQTTDQSCLNRYLTAADWDVHQVNQRRLDLLQQDPSTRYSNQGVLPGRTH